MHHKKPIFYLSKTFSKEVANYTTYDKYFYTLVQNLKKWKHYLTSKETIMHIDHQPLECLQSQTKIQQSKHFIWMGFLKQFHLVIKYKN